MTALAQPYAVATSPEPGITLLEKPKTLEQRYLDATGFAPESVNLNTPADPYSFQRSVWVDISISGPGTFLGRAQLVGGQILDCFTIQQLENAEYFAS